MHTRDAKDRFCRTAYCQISKTIDITGHNNNFMYINLILQFIKKKRKKKKTNSGYFAHSIESNNIREKMFHQKLILNNDIYKLCDI